MSPRTQNASQHVLTKPHTTGLQKESEHALIKTIYATDDTKCTQPTPFHASEERKYLSACVNQTQLRASENTKSISTLVHSMPARTENMSELVFTKHVPCHREHKMYFNMC
jgi:hypothetical protein